MEKLYYSISEVSEEVGEEPHILRYWEKEFPILKPKKNRGGNRSYTSKDIEVIKEIKRLIRDEKLSLPGARQKIELNFDKSQGKSLTLFDDYRSNGLSNEKKEKLLKIKQDLTDIIELIKSHKY